MDDAPQTSSAARVSLPRFLGALLRLSWRLPRILPALRSMARVDAENRESWGSMLEENAAAYPAHPAIKSPQTDLTWAQFNAAANRHAHHFTSLGIGKGDVVAVVLENRAELLVIYSALAKIGAVSALINTNLRLDSLRHCLALNPARAFVIGEEMLGPFQEVLPDLAPGEEQTLFFVPDRGKTPTPAGFVDLVAAAASCPCDNPPTTATVTPSDPIAYVFTSGTTGGMPKAAVIPHGRLVKSRYLNGRVVLDIKPGDTLFVPLPFFHTNAIALSWPAVFAGGAAVAIQRKFSASRFLDDVRRFDATIWCYVGELCRYLVKQPPRPDDRDHPLRKVIGNGLRPDIWDTFKHRFGITHVYEIYGAAESNLYFVNLLNLDRTVGVCLVPYAVVRYDVDNEEPVRGPGGWMERVKVGEAGLLLGEISASNPFAGYTSPEATQTKILHDVFAAGDAWFDTGDLVRPMGWGHIQFSDRTGDTFRWKGENVSTTEVEKVVNSFPGVALAAAYGVTMPGGDGRAGMIAVVPEGTSEHLDLAGLASHLERHLPSYAVPRFLRLCSDLESTPTHKIKRVRLRNEAFDPALVADPLFVLLPGEPSYRPLTPDIHARVRDGEYRF